MNSTILNLVNRAILTIILPLLSFSFGNVSNCRATDAITTAEIISECSPIAPDIGCSIGVLFKIKSGWHIYSKNPGDAGLPTKIEFTFPKGIEVSELQWPIPYQFISAGDIKTNGYSDQVILFTNIVAPSSAVPGENLLIKAKVSWLNCSDSLCVPERADLEFSLPVDDTPRFSNKAIFDEWRSRL